MTGGACGEQAPPRPAQNIANTGIGADRSDEGDSVGSAGVGRLAALRDGCRGDDDDQAAADAEREEVAEGLERRGWPSHGTELASVTTTTTTSKSDFSSIQRLHYESSIAWHHYQKYF